MELQVWRKTKEIDNCSSNGGYLLYIGLLNSGPGYSELLTA